MEKERLEQYRQSLIEQMQRLLSEAGKTVGGMAREEGRAHVADPTDRAAVESDRNFQLRIRDRERKLIAKIQQALGRIDDGSFGLCESCGAEISEERLQARPVTTLCIDCKSEEEARERGK